MKAKIEVILNPFQVPNFVFADVPPRPRQEGMIEAPKYALEELDVETLEKLCDEFTEAVFKKAGKRRPPRDLCG